MIHRRKERGGRPRPETNGLPCDLLTEPLHDLEAGEEHGGPDASGLDERQGAFDPREDVGRRGVSREGQTTSTNDGQTHTDFCELFHCLPFVRSLRAGHVIADSPKRTPEVKHHQGQGREGQVGHLRR